MIKSFTAGDIINFKKKLAEKVAEKGIFGFRCFSDKKKEGKRTKENSVSAAVIR